MKFRTLKIWISLLLSILLFIQVLSPVTTFAREWWIKEVTYTAYGREPITHTGSHTRIFLPEVKATLRDGIEMAVNYSVSKGEEVLASGAYEQGVYYDLDGAGEYVFTYQGVDASNTYSFTVTADDNLPSIILDKEVATSGYTDKPFNIPKATIISNSVEKEAQVTLTMANGNQYHASDRIVPEDGKMTVTYWAEHESGLLEFSYEAEIMNPEIGFYDENGNFYPAGTKAYEHEDLSGSVLNGVGLKYTFSEIINLTDMTIDIPLITINNAAQTGSSLPKIKIVDIYDSQNYLEINMKQNVDASVVVYSVSKAPNQSLIGLRGGKVSSLGSNTTFPYGSGTTKKHPATYYWNDAEKALYVGYYSNKSVFNDFDADFQTYPWSGFTTGEVYIVIERQRATDFVCVQNIAGRSLETVSRDTYAPTLCVDAPTEIPYAVVGKVYQIFSASAMDPYDASVPVSIEVYKGADATSGIALDCANGSFVPYEAGYYTIVYSAKDVFNNKAVKKVNILAIEEKDAPAIDATIAGIPETIFVGEKLNIPQPQNISGGSGVVSTKIIAHLSDGSKEEITEDHYIFTTEGKHTVAYVLTDYIGTEQIYSFDINCEQSSNPILYSTVMPEYLCAGKKFTLPTAQYYDTGDITITVEAFLDGNELDIVDNTVVLNTENTQSELVLTYHAENSTGSASESYKIAVLKGDVADRTTFFNCVKGDMTTQQKDESMYVVATESESAVRFINSVLASKFGISFMVDPAHNDADRISIKVSDAMDASISLQLDMMKKADGDATSKTDFYINGEKISEMAGNFYGGSDALRVVYNEKTLSFADAIGTSLGKPSKTLSGQPFSGFPSGQVNIEISVGTVGEKGIGFDILQINNQNFFEGDLFFDSYAELNLLGSLSLQSEIGSQISIPAAIAGDVLSPNAEVTVTVKRDNEIVVPKQSAAEPFEFTLDSYGKYQVTYQYSDGGMSRSANYSINTMEYTPPTAKLPSGLPSTAKLNQKISLSMPEVSDDYTQNVNISVLVMEPNGNLLLINKEEMAFGVRYTGTYTVIYQVYDECYNYQTLTHAIQVTDEQH